MLLMVMDVRVDINDSGARSIMLIRLSIILGRLLIMHFIRLIILLMIYFIKCGQQLAMNNDSRTQGSQPLL